MLSSLGSVLAVHVFVDRLMDDLPGTSVLGSCARVALAGRTGGLAPELAMAGQTLLGQPAIGQGDRHGAAWFALVATVAEPARCGDVDDIVERGIDALVGSEHLERPDTRRVDEQRAARQLEQLAMGRRVAAARV